MFNNMMMGGMIPLKLADRNTCTINGKPMKQVEEELLKGLPEELLKENYDKFSYFPAEVLIERLEEVVGPLNYTVVPMPVQAEPMRYIARPNKEALQKQKADAMNADERKKLGRELTDAEKVKYWNVEIPPEELEPYECVEFLEKVISAIAIYADSGELAILKYAYGSGKYEFVNITGKLREPKNVPDAAVSDATKRACKDLGIGSKQLADKKKQTELDKKQEGTEVFTVKLLKRFSTSKGYSRCPVLVEKTNEQKELFVGKDCMLSDSNKDVLLAAPVGQIVTVRGKKNTFNGKDQIILVDVVKGGKDNG